MGDNFTAKQVIIILQVNNSKVQRQRVKTRLHRITVKKFFTFRKEVHFFCG